MGMQFMEFNLVEVAKIHFANGYDKDGKAHEAFNRVCNELGGASWADAFSAPSWGNYADAVEAIDDEPFVSYEEAWDWNDVSSPHHY
jgi:hypothetical protein